MELLADPVPAEHSFMDAAVEYVLSLERRGKDPSRAINDLKLVDPWIGSLPLSHIHQGALKSFEAAQRGVRKSGTVARCYRTTVAVLNHAARVLRDGNRPWLAIATPKIVAPDWGDARKPYRLTWREQDALFEALPAHLQCPALFAVATGAREQEVMSLRWDQEVFTPGLPKGSVWWIPPEIRKGNARKAASAQEGRCLIANTLARRAIDHQRRNDSDWVFPGPSGGRVQRLNNTGWKMSRRMAGLAQVRVHDLRHTFGERLEAAGVPWEYRKVLLGHTVQDITAHYSAPGLAQLLVQAEKVTRATAWVRRPTLVTQNVTHTNAKAARRRLTR